MRPIDADALIHHFYETEYASMYYIEVVKRIIDAQPTLSPDEVRDVGEWINKTMSVPNGHGQTYNRWGCSKCKAKFKTRTNYCPNCGARLEVSEDA